MRDWSWGRTPADRPARPARAPLPRPHRARARRRCSPTRSSRSRRRTWRSSRSTRGSEELDLDRLTWIIALFLASAVVALVLSAANTYLTGWVGERVLADLRNKLFAHLERLSLGFYERNRAGVIISRITNDVEALDQLVTDGVTSLIQNTLLLLGTAVVLFFLDWQARARDAHRARPDGARS